MPLRLLFLLLFVGLSSCSEAPLPDGVSEEEVEDGLSMVSDIWRKGGKVVFGKLDPLPDVPIASRVPIGKQGQFCAPVAEGRVLTFYAHGYDPIWVKDFEPHRKSVYDAGMVTLQKADAAKLRSWTCEVSEPKGRTPVSAALWIENQDYLFEDHGYMGNARPWVKVETKSVSPGQSVTFEGLSNLPYVVRFSGKGLIAQSVSIDEWANGEIRAEPVNMVVAQSFRITYRARTRTTGGQWQEDERLNSQTFVCDGKDEFLFSDVKCGLGNALDLRMKPEAEGVKASFFMYGDDNFIDLGEGAISPDLHWDQIDRVNGSAYAFIKPGYHYLFQKSDINGVDVELLFSVK